jgi:hypothetical protein
MLRLDKEVINARVEMMIMDVKARSSAVFQAVIWNV